MLCIEKIRIKNFRSIDDAQIDCSEMNIFVGNNDVGKSNILRALNLFFNGYTGFNQPFNFAEDFNKFTVPGRGKAREIFIELELKLPSTFRRGKTRNNSTAPRIIWRKTWRREGYYVEGSFRVFDDGKDIPRRSKIPTFLDRILYEYVPAIKDQHFFADMQGRMYDVLSQISDEQLRGSAASFEKAIQENVNELVSELIEVFKGNSTIKLPANLRSIFETLDFNDAGISFQYRGDGIKVRHIPLILKFVAEKRNSLMSYGGIRHTFIWGYEEPENNVEMSSCFDLAKQLMTFVEDNTQMFLTTHSPAFYMLSYDPHYAEHAVGYFVDKTEGSTTFTQLESSRVDERMGLMTVVAPYVAEEKEKAKILQKEVDRLEKEHTTPHLFVEGKSDKLILEKAAKYASLPTNFDCHVDAGDSGGYGSANAVANRAIAWGLINAHQQAPVKAVAVFDDDDAGRAARKMVTDQTTASKYVKCLSVPKSEAHIAIIRKAKSLNKSIKLPSDLESLYSDKFWAFADGRGWIAPRQNLQQVFDSNTIRESLVGDAGLKGFSKPQKRRIFNTFSDDGKGKAAKYLSKLKKAEFLDYASETLRVVDEVAKRLTNS